MAIIKYTTDTFNKDEAASGKLCVCELTTTTKNPIYSNDINDGFVGAGICIYKDYKFHLTINGKLYIFNDKGAAVNSAAAAEGSGVGCKLVMAVIDSGNVTRGSVVTTHIQGTDPTRGETGDYSPAGVDSYNDDTSTGVLVESLNARDHFASQVLQTLLARMEKDPATLSDNEMSYLSDVAYKWAANMMTAAANARAGIDDQSQAATSEVTVQSLDNNTEKLLNNIEAALKRTDGNIADEGEDPVYAERIHNPKLLEWLDAYADNGETGEAHGKLGLKDLIDAISQGGGGGGTGGTVQIGDEGLGRNRANPFFISNSDESKYVPYAIYQYRSKGEAESDGWEFDSTDNVWKKAYYNDVPGSYTDESAKSLPTWKNVVKVSIVEMADLIAAVNNVADAIRNQ